MEIVELRKTESKHDIQFKGKTLKLRLLPCRRGGIDIQYVLEQEPKKDGEPFNFLEAMMGGPTVFAQKCVRLNWLEKSLGFSLDKKITRWVPKLKAIMEEAIKKTEQLEKLKTELGVSDGVK